LYFTFQRLVEFLLKTKKAYFSDFLCKVKLKIIDVGRNAFGIYGSLLF